MLPLQDIDGLWVIDDRLTALRVRTAESFWQRLVGVGFRVGFQRFEVLHLPRCQAVHSFGLSRAIDVMFVSESMRVLSVRSMVRPWQAVWYRGAASVWETRAGTARALGIEVGSRFAIRPWGFALPVIQPPIIQPRDSATDSR